MRKLAYKALLWLVDWIFGPKWEEYDMNGHPKITMKIPVGMQFKLSRMLRGGLPTVPKLAPVKDRVPPSTIGEAPAVKARRERLNAMPWGSLRDAIGRVMRGIRSHAGWKDFVGTDGTIKQETHLSSGVEGDKWGYDYWGDRLFGLLGLFNGWQSVEVFSEEWGADAIVNLMFGVFSRLGDAGLADVQARLVATAPEFGFDPREEWVATAGRAIKSQEDVIAGIIGLSPSIPMSRIRHSLASWVKMKAAVSSAGNIDELVRNLRGLKGLEQDAQKRVAEWLLAAELLAAE